jgi:carbon starvation protein
MKKARYSWVTILPMLWLVTITMTAGCQKIFHGDPRIGFLAEASRLESTISSGMVSPDKIATVQRQIFNNRLDAIVTALFLTMVLVILIDCTREWLAILSRRKIPVLCEAEYKRTNYE